MQSTPAVPVKPNNMPWYTQTWFTFVMLIFVPPIGWYFLWKYRDWHLGAKVALVIASIVWVIYANVSEDARQKEEKQAVAQTTPKPIPASQKSDTAKTQIPPDKKNSSPKSSLEKNKNVVPVNVPQRSGKEPVEEKARYEQKQSAQEQKKPTDEQFTANGQTHEAATQMDTEDDGCKEVKSSAWDGSVLAVKLYLRSNLNDWQSTQFVEWSPIVKKPELRISVVRCKFRTKNALGAYVMKNWVFYLGCDGEVLSYENYPF